MNNVQTVRIRWMQPEDIPQVQGIEVAEHVYPWTDQEFENALSLDGIQAYVAYYDYTAVAGYMFIEPRRRRYNLLNMTVSWRYDKHEVKAALFSHLKSKLKKGMIETIVVYLDPRNLDSQVYLRDFQGFRCTGTEARNTDVVRDGEVLVFKYKLPKV